MNVFLTHCQTVVLILTLFLAAGSNGGESGILAQFPHRKQTKFFDFYYKQNEGLISETARFADGFVRVIHRQFFTADYNYPIKVLVLEDEARFGAFLRNELGISDPPHFGMFFPTLNMLVTREDSGLGTFAHEILHPLVEASLPLHPIWATEGIPSFFEKFYGYWEGDNLVLRLGYQNPWRIHALGTELTNLDLRQILGYKDTQGRFSECEQRMVSMFLWQEGKFKSMLKLIEKGVPVEGYTTWFESAMGAKVDEITPRWQDYLRRTAAEAGEIMKLPPSAILANEAEYKVFAVRHSLPLHIKDDP